MRRFIPNSLLAACVFLTIITHYWIIAILGIIGYFSITILPANKPESSNQWKIETICTLVTTILVLLISVQNYNNYQNVTVPNFTEPIVIRFPGEEPAHITRKTPFNQIREFVS